MKNEVTNQVAPVEQPDELEAIELQNQQTLPDSLEVENDIPTYPDKPESEESFRGYKIAPVEEGEETAPLEKDVINDPWNETSDLTVDDVNMPGDKQDEYYEKLGHQAEKNENSLGPEHYHHLKITKGENS